MRCENASWPANELTPRPLTILKQCDNRHGPGQSPARDRTGFEETPSNPACGQQRAAHTRAMEFHLSIKPRIAALALAALAVTGPTASPTQSAEARGLGWGIGAGLIGAAVV